MTKPDHTLASLLGETTYAQRTITSPEGVPLTVSIATRSSRVTAFLLDCLFMLIMIVLLYSMILWLFFTNTNIALGVALVQFLTFLVRNLYFIHFELAWQGRTPGKKICKTRVISRNGGPLTPTAIIARNVTREVEFFLPLSLLFGVVSGGWAGVTLFGWALCITALPLFNKNRLRAGDLIAGTQVIAMPKRVLLPDLAAPSASNAGTSSEAIDSISGAISAPGTAGATNRTNTRDASTTATAPQHETAPSTTPAQKPVAAKEHVQGKELLANSPPTGEAFIFTHQQLAVYGNYELQVLEELLRSHPTPEQEKLLQNVCAKICTKIQWETPVPQPLVRQFLNDFYTAQRAVLERRQLFGKTKANKHA